MTNDVIEYDVINGKYQILLIGGFFTVDAFALHLNRKYRVYKKLRTPQWDMFNILTKQDAFIMVYSQ
jgi:hypothetical protein